jgi:hypothetical protein
MPHGAERFHYREELDQARAAQWTATREMTLVQRTAFEKPSVPPLVSRGTIASHAAKLRSSSFVPPTAPHTTRQLSIPEFIVNRREIFLIQLMIQRKHAEMSDMESEVALEEQNFIDTEQKISELSYQYKLATAQAEASVAQARRAAEEATKQRMDLQKQYRQTQHQTGLLRSQITKNRDTLDHYQRYTEFMKSVTPDGLSWFDFFIAPSRLIGELDRLQSSTRFLVGQYESLSAALETRVEPLAIALETTGRSIESVEARLDGVPATSVFDGGLTDGDLSMAGQVDDELAHLTRLIERVHTGHFGGSGSVPALLMLERIEAALEDLYRQFARVKPQFADAKQRKKDEERLEKHKRVIAAKKESEQQLKFEIALERAQKPIKRRTGRPHVERMLPITGHRKDPQQSLAEKKERERVEQWLYGPDIE